MCVRPSYRRSSRAEVPAHMPRSQQLYLAVPSPKLCSPCPHVREVNILPAPGDWPQWPQSHGCSCSRPLLVALRGCVAEYYVKNAHFLPCLRIAWLSRTEHPWLQALFPGCDRCRHPGSGPACPARYTCNAKRIRHVSCLSSQYHVSTWLDLTCTGTALGCAHGPTATPRLEPATTAPARSCA